MGNECREAPGDNRHPSMALGWWIGAMAGSMAEWHLDGQLRWDVEHVRAAVARSKRRGRIALVITDHLKTHTSAGSLLVREPGATFVEGALVPGVYTRL